MRDVLEATVDGGSAFHAGVVYYAMMQIIKHGKHPEEKFIDKTCCNLCHCDLCNKAKTAVLESLERAEQFWDTLEDVGNQLVAMREKK